MRNQTLSLLVNCIKPLKQNEMELGLKCDIIE